MTALLAFDAANPGVSIRAMKRAGAIVAPVYIVGSPGGFAPSGPARVAALRKAGLAPLPNWERTADFFATCTLDQARRAGVEALEAGRALGFPDDGSITPPFSFDFDCPPSRYGEMADKLAVANTGLAGAYRAIAYAQSGLIEYLAAHGQPGPHWLMASTFRASSQFTAAEVGSPHVAMVQSHDAYGGWLDSPIGGTDVNTITRPAELGAWWPDNSPYGGSMPITPADADTLWKHPVAAADGEEHQAGTWLIRAKRQAEQAAQAAVAVQAELDQLRAEVTALKQTGAMQVQATSVPVTGTVTFGGTK